MEYIPGFVILAIMSIPYILLLIDKFTGKHLACDYFGWHNGQGGATSFDGCSVHASCSKCGKSVMQDSQGNWF